MSKKLVTAIAIASSSCLLLVAGFGFGSYWSQTQPSDRRFDWPEVLNADSATGGKALSLATGFLEIPDLESVFVLDHLTGRLFCWVVDPRTARFVASFETSVLEDLAVQGKAGDMDYVMVTGFMDFKGRVNNLKPANTIVYVAEGNSGRVAAYGVQFNKQSGVGSIFRLDVGQTRLPIRDQGN